MPLSWQIPKDDAMQALSGALSRNFSRILVRHMEKRRLSSAPPITKTKRNDRFWYLEGTCLLAREHSASVLMQVLVDVDWLSSPPLVRCSGSFMNRTIDWHCSEKGDLCYVHPVEWFEDHQSNLRFFRKTTEKAILRSALWVMDSVDDLLHKHFLGWESGLKKWPDEWLQWKHGKEGIRQYFDEKAQAHN